MSPQVEAMLGYSLDEWLSGDRFGLQIMVEEDRELAQRITDQVIQTGVNGVIQFRWRTRDGRIVWAESHLNPIFDERGNTAGLRGVTLDITDRKLAEEELKSSEATYRAVFNAASDAILVFDREQGSILDANQRMTEMYGYTVDEVRQLNMGDLSLNELPYTLENAAKWMKQAAAGKPQLFEWQAKHKSGRLFWVEMNLKLASLGGKEVLLAVVRDISEPRRLAAAATSLHLKIQKALTELHESEDRFGKAFRANPQPMSITTVANGKYVDVNESFLTMSGYAREEVIGHTSHELKVWETPQTRNGFIDQLKDQGSLVNVETRFRRKDGSFRVLLSSAERLEMGGEECLILASSDITERKESELALRKAHEELSQMQVQLEAENIYLQQELQLDRAFGEIVGHSDAIKYVLAKISQVSPTDSTVLITGETGTGKELVAHAIHDASLRKDRPLIRVNCAALSASLIESELFGHEKGAFTGATARKLGRFELADGGTIFLDEIGELPLELQKKLLRVLQEGEFERLGGTKTIRVNVRVISATNRNLKLLTEKGAFREDLWYRLNVFPITVPPLRQRKEDIPNLVEHFVHKSARKLGKTITSVSPRAMQSLQAHSWPGNVRELANVIERAVIQTQGTVLHLVESLQPLEEPAAAVKSLEEIEREHVIRTLDSCGWRIEGPYGAAKILGLNPSTLRARLAKLGIQRPNHTSV
jgi:PAS domain S-box-containing protein